MSELVTVESLAGVADRPGWPGYLPGRLASMREQLASAQADYGSSADIWVIRIVRDSGGEMVWMNSKDAYRLHIALEDDPTGNVYVRFIDDDDAFNRLTTTDADGPPEGAWERSVAFFFGGTTTVPEFYDSDRNIKANSAGVFRGAEELSDYYRKLRKLRDSGLSYGDALDQLRETG